MKSIFTFLILTSLTFSLALAKSVKEGELRCRTENSEKQFSIKGTQFTFHSAPKSNSFNSKRDMAASGIVKSKLLPTGAIEKRVTDKGHRYKVFIANQNKLDSINDYLTVEMVGSSHKMSYPIHCEWK